MPKSFLDLVNDALNGAQPPLFFQDDVVAQLQRGVWARSGPLNTSVVAQSFTASTRTHVLGSALRVPPTGLRIGTMCRWRFNMSKTAAGSATSTFEVTHGVNGNGSDLTQLSVTKPAGTAAVDSGRVEILMTVRGPISDSGVIAAEFSMIHNLASTGHMVIPACCINSISTPFDVTVPNAYFGICLTTGAADVITTNIVQAEMIGI